METKAYCLNCFSEMGGSEVKCVHCGWTDEGQMKNALPYGTLLNEKYLIGQAVRQNGSGFTYAALEKKSNRKVEIREFFPDLIHCKSQCKPYQHLQSKVLVVLLLVFQ